MPYIAQVTFPKLFRISLVRSNYIDLQIRIKNITMFLFYTFFLRSCISEFLSSDIWTHELTALLLKDKVESSTKYFSMTSAAGSCLQSRTNWSRISKFSPISVSGSSSLPSFILKNWRKCCKKVKWYYNLKIDSRYQSYDRWLWIEFVLYEKSFKRRPRYQ